MQAVSYLAPALAPLAVKLIDKYIFDDDRPTVPQIIQIPASPQCCCRCRGQTSDGNDSTQQTCSTCCSSKSSSSSSYRPSKHRLSTKLSVRPSSTSDAYNKKRSESPACTRRLSDSTMKSVRKSEKQSITDGDTLAILAGQMKHEIGIRHSKTSSHSSSKLRRIEKSSPKVNIAKTTHSSSSRIKACCYKDIHGLSRKSNCNSDGLKVSNIS